MGLTPIRVGQLNSYISRVLKTDPLLSDVSVTGEVSNLKFHHSGHVYFSLKDEASRVNCFLPARVAQVITLPLEEGMEIIATGYISVYERGGYYSLNITGVETGGKGELAIRFEKLKQKLEQEGLFDPARKKPIPEFPEKIAIVTSPTGAAVRDILKIIKNKNDYVDILISPVLVQGPSAAADIAAAIDDLNENHPDVDVIITGRGGGSAEELWAFNEEVVARSISRSEIPVISAVGHEIDFTISDFVADLRAETPTAAAEIAVPDTFRLKEYLDEIRGSMTELMLRHTELASRRLQALDPAAFASGIRTRIEYEQMYLDRLIDGMQERVRSITADRRNRIEMLRQVIEAANPNDILKRGYSIVTDEGGRVLRSSEGLQEGQNVTIRMSEGSADAALTAVRKEPGL